jgi:predicted DNA-binding protein
MCAKLTESSGGRKKRASSEDVFFNIRLDRDLHGRLTDVARRNERTTAAEIRVAIREHLDRLGEAA